MGSRLGRRVVNFANLPIKLLMPPSFSNITEIALKTIPSASKIEIKRVLESLYGFEVEKVQTLNMDGKKKKRGGLLFAKPDYKKAYVTLKYPLSISPDLYPIRLIEEDKKSLNKQSKSSFVEGDEAKKKSHWLDGNAKPETSSGRWRGRDRGGNQGGSGGRYGKASQGGGSGAQLKFPWSSMRPSSR